MCLSETVQQEGQGRGPRVRLRAAETGPLLSGKIGLQLSCVNVGWLGDWMGCGRRRAGRDPAQVLSCARGHAAAAVIVIPHFSLGGGTLLRAVRLGGGVFALRAFCRRLCPAPPSPPLLSKLLYACFPLLLFCVRRAAPCRIRLRDALRAPLPLFAGLSGAADRHGRPLQFPCAGFTDGHNNHDCHVMGSLCPPKHFWHLSRARRIVSSRTDL